MCNIEVEYRAIITKEKYDWLNNFLLSNGKDLGQDNKDTTFYIMKDKLFKVVNEVSKGEAKIVLKDNHIASGSSLREWELKIDPSSCETAVDLFNHLGLPAKTTSAYQERYNYIYKDIEIAVKYSEQWQYHIEMEIVVDDETKKIEAEEKIKSLSIELEIELMSNDKIREFTKKFEENL